MSATSLIALAREFWRDGPQFKQRYDHPWFVWSIGRPTDAPIVAPTLSIGGVTRVPAPGDPLAIPIAKGKASVFAMGITVGRTENNDVVLRHEQVSRFHAYFSQTPHGLALVDAESKNGTRVGGVPLAPKKPHLLPPQCKVSFGDLEVQYFSAAAFFEHLTAR